MLDLSRLLRPRSVAILGGSWARAVLRRLQEAGFAGDLWPVHPDKAEMEGLPAFRSLADLPSAPDAVFIGVNRHAAIAAARELSAMGAGGAVCFASGFGEVGPEGAALQAELVEAAGRMPILGPNCYGLLNYLDGACLWPDVHGGARVARGVALVAQSSNIALNITMSRRALPLAYVICLGNQAMAGLADAVATLAEDPRVSVILLHIEGINDGPAFAAACLKARAAGKPIVALKTGRSARAAEITRTHTASLAGGAAAADAFLARCGVSVAAGLPEALEAAKLLHHLGPLAGEGLASMSCSGGEAALMADAAEAAGVSMPAFAPAHEARVRATVQPLVTVSNPFDYHTFDWGNGPRLTETFAAVMEGPQALTALVLDFPKESLGPAPGWDTAVESLAAAARRTGRKAAILATLPENLPESATSAIAAQGLAPMMGVSEMMAAFRAAQAAAAPLEPFAPLRPPAPGAARALSEPAAKALLARHGLAVPEGELCATLEQALAAQARLGRCAFKAAGAHLAHKTELGAVMLNISDEAAARAAFSRLRPMGEGVLVERMLDKPVAELILGAAPDPAAGWTILIGAGGVLAELTRDRALLVIPFAREEARGALRSLKAAPLLAGWRGAPAADEERILDAVMSFQAFVVAQADRLSGAEINPLMAGADYAAAADALIILKEDQPS